MPENKDEFTLSKEEAQKKLLTYKPQEGVLSKIPESIVDQGESQYDEGFVIPEENKLEQLNEYRAQNQSTLDRWGNAVPRLVSKTATEVAKIPGYIGGGLGYLTSGDLSPKNFADYIDNGWIDTLNNLDEKTKETFKTYTPKAVKEGNLWDNLTSASFWTTEGVDGAGFLLAALAPGAAVSKLGAGAKLAKGLDLTAKTARNIDLGLATGINTTYEAMSEANGLVTDLKKNLVPKIGKEINPKTGKLWSQEEVDESIGNAGVESFLSNMALLVGPNLLMNKNLLGKFNTTKNNLSKITDASGNIIEAITPASKKAVLGDMLKNIGLNVASEGFIEEGGQFALESYLKKQALKQTDKGFIEGVASEYLNALGTTEGQKSIALGALFGSVSGTIGSYREGKQEDKQLQGLRELFNSNLNTYSSNITDLYKRDENGDIILDKDNKPVKDTIKISQIIEDKLKAETRSQIKDAYAISGNKEMFDLIRNDEFTDFAIPYLAQDGGIELLNKHIDNLSDNLKRELEQIEGVKPDSKQDIVTELKQKARKLQDIYDKVELYGPEFTQLDVKNPEDKELADRFLNKNKFVLINEASRQNFYKERIQDLSMEQTKLLASGLPLDLEIEKQVGKNLELYKEALSKSVENYKNLLKKDNLQKLFEIELEKANAQKEEEIKVTQEREAKKSDIADKIDNDSELTPEEEDFVAANPEEVQQELIQKDKEKENQKTKDLDKYIARHSLKEGGEAKLGNLPVTIEMLNKEDGTAIIKVMGSENDFRTINIKELYKSNEQREDFINREQVLISEALTNNSKGLTEETVNQDSNDKLTTNTSDPLDQESLGQVDAKSIGKVSDVVMFKQFLGSIEYIPIGKGFKKIFKWIRGEDGLPKIETDRSNIDFLSLNDSEKVKTGTKIYFKYYDLDEPARIRKEAQILANKEAGQPYPETEDIGIFLSPDADKPIGFVQLPHPVIQTPDDTNLANKTLARNNLIKERANIISKLNNLEEVSSTISQKGTGKLITRLTREGKVALKTPEGNYINLFDKIRNEDLILNKPIFVYNSGTKLTLPTIQQIGDKKRYEKIKEDLTNQISVYGNWGNPGQTFILVKSLNGGYYPAPVYSTPINSKTSTKILEILRQNSKADTKTIINKLQHYVYASLSEGAHKLIIDKVANGDILVKAGTAGEKINISTGFTAEIQNQLKNEIEAKLKHNIDIKNINTKVTQDYLKENGVLTTNIEIIDGEFFGQPYISYESLLSKEEVPLAIAKEIKGESLVSDIFKKIEEKREEEIKILNYDYDNYQRSKTTGEFAKFLKEINDKYDNQIKEVKTEIGEELNPGWTEEDIEKDLKREDPTINQESLTDLINKQKKTKNPFASSKEARQKKSKDAFSTSIPNDTFENEEEENFIKNNLPQFKREVIEDLKTIHNQEVLSVGMFRDLTMYIANNAPKGTTYHEAFHAVYRSLLSSNEQLELQKEAREKYSKPTEEELNRLIKQSNTINDLELHDLYYEEKLAESFKDYMNDFSPKEILNKTFGQKISVFFDRLLDIINSLFRTSKSNIDSLFSKIRKGEYKDKKPTILRGSSYLNEIAFSQIPGFTDREKNETVITMGNYFINNYFQQINNGVLPSEINVVNIFKEIQEEYKGISKEEGLNPKQFALANNIVDQFNPLKKEVGKFLLTKGIKVNKDILEYSEQMFSDEDISEAELQTLESNITKTYGSNMTSIPGLSSASTRLKLFLSSIPVTEESGDIKSDILGMPIFHDFTSLYYYIEKNLIGFKYYDDMISQLELLSEDRPELLEVVSRLNDPSDLISDIERKRLQSDFKSNFSKQNLNYILTLWEKEGDTGFSYKIMNSNREGLNRELLQKFKNNLLDRTRNTISEPNKETGEYITIGTNKAKELRDYYKKIFESNKNNTEKFTLKQIKDITSSIGIDYSERTVNKLFKEQPAAFFNNLELVLNWYAEGLEYHNFKENISKRQDEEAALKKLVSIEVSNNYDLYTSSFTNIEKKQIYAIQLPSFLSKQMDTLTSDNYEEFEEHLNGLYKDPSYKYNNILSDLLQDNKLRTENFKYSYTDGLKNSKGDLDGKGYTQVKDRDFLAQQLAMFNNGNSSIGYYNYLINADKSLNTLFSFKKYGVNIDSNGELSKDSEIIDSFYNVFLSEYERIKSQLIVKDKYSRGEVTDLDLIETYHYKKGSKPSAFDGKAFIFNHFTSLNKKDIKDRIFATIGKNIDSKDALIDLQEEIKGFIIEELQEVHNSGIKEAISKGIVKKEEGSLTNNFLDINNSEFRNSALKTVNHQINQILGLFNLNTYLMNIELSKLFNGDDSIYKDLFKRTYQSGAMTVHSNNKKDDKIKIILVKDEKSSTESSVLSNWEKGFKENNIETDIKSIKDSYSNNNITDAQVWIHPTLYKRLMEERGIWSESMERAHNIALSTEITDIPEELNGLITGIKPFGYGVRFNEKLGIWQPEQIKCAIIPLYPIFNKDNPLMTKNYELMEKTGVHMIAHESSFKAASQGKLDIKDLTEESILNNTIDFDANYFGFQVDNPNHSFEENNNAIRQIKMLMLGNIDITKTYGGRSGKEIREEIDAIEASDINNELNILLQEINGPDKTKFKERLIESLNSRKQFTENLENALLINESTGKFEFPLDFGPFSKEIQNLISSIFTKSVLLPSFKGGSAVQVSSLGIKFKNLSEQQEEVEKDEELSVLQSELKTVRFTEDGKEVEYAEAIVPSWSKDFFGEKGLIKGDIPEDLKKILIYRIPTEGFHSMLPIKVIKFLPETYGNFILLPYEVTTQFGADFDFDKMYFIVPEYSKSKDGLLKKVEYSQSTESEDVNKRWNNYINSIKSSKKVKTLLEELGYNTQLIDKYTISNIYNNLKKEEKPTELTNTLESLFNVDFTFQDILELLQEEGLSYSEEEFKSLPIPLQNSKKARKNRILDNYLTILASPNTIEHILNPSGFSELENAKNVIDAENREFGFKENNLSFYTGEKQREYKKRNHATINAKGQAALHVTGHSYGILLDLDSQANENSISFNDKKDKTSLSELKNFNNKLISRECASVLAAVLDDIKNPIMYTIGVNNNTLDIYMMLLRAGFSHETNINFLTQPIVREISDKLDNNINELKEKGFKYYFIDESIKDLTGSIKKSIESIEDINKRKRFEIEFQNVLNIIDIQEAPFQLTDKDMIAHRRFSKSKGIIPKEELESFSIIHDIYQLKVAYNFKKYDEISKSLVKYNKFFAINKEVGPNIENIDELLYTLGDISLESNIVKGIENLDQFKALSVYLKVQTEARGFLSTHFPYSSGVYSDLKQELTNALLKGGKRFNIEKRTKINNTIGFYLGLKYPVIGTVTNREEKEDLLKSSKESLSVGAELLTILNPNNDSKNLFSNGEKIRENKFLQMLSVIPSKEKMGVDIIRLKGAKLDNFTKDDLKDAFLDLYNRPETKELSMRLLKYSYLSSGFHTGLRTFYQILPVEILRDIRYHINKLKDIDKLDKGLYELSEEERNRFTDQFIRNNPKFTKVFDIENFRENKEEIPNKLSLDTNTIKNKEIILGKDFVGEYEEKDIYRNSYPAYIRVYNAKARKALLYKREVKEDQINNILEETSYNLINTLGKTGDFLEYDINNDIEESVYSGNNIKKGIVDNSVEESPEDNYADTESFIEESEIPENQESVEQKKEIEVSDKEVKDRIKDCE